MQRIFRALLLGTLILGACSGSVDSPPVGEANCAYQWAHKDLPELTRQFQEGVKALNPEASARATAFGEDCVYSNGYVEFSAMETDFYVEMPAGDLNDPKSLGDWIAQVMPIVEELPDESIAGPQPGFAEFKFIKSDSEFLFVRVPIQQYRETASSKTGEELFRMFYTEP